ncbi:MAG TPA: hypothetical protein DCP91_10280 [Eggerthellaceae bacterium]|nr:hypothetical protein [Eggerthellaceae bacterium]
MPDGNGSASRNSSEIYPRISDALNRFISDSANGEGFEEAFDGAIPRPWGLLGVRNQSGHRSPGCVEIPREFDEHGEPWHMAHACDDSTLYLLVAYESTAAVVEALKAANKHRTIVVVQSLPFESTSAIAQQRELIAFAFTLCDSKTFVNAKDYALDFLVDQLGGLMDTSGLLHPGIAMLERYDRHNRSDLLHTLKVYLDNDCNAQKCGRLLFLHRNSLVYRVRRIQEIANIDLSDPCERSYLRLSFLLRR